MAPTSDLVGEAADRHVVHFYDHDEALAAGHSAVVGPPAAPDPVTVMPCDLEAEFLWSGRSPGQARRFVVDTLAEWGCWALLDDAAVITTELATNAVLHAQSGFTYVPISSAPIPLAELFNILSTECTECELIYSEHGDEFVHNQCKLRVHGEQGPRAITL